MIVQKQFSVFFNSSTASGALARSADGSQFSVRFIEPISFPVNTVYAEMAVTQAGIWNTSPNLSVAFGNNNFSCNVTGTPITFTFPDGLYSLSDIQSYLNVQLNNNAKASNSIAFSGLDATGNVLLTFLNAGDSVDFTIANSIRALLGFNSAVITSTTAGEVYISDSTAQLDRTNSFLISSDLIGSSIPVNGVSTGIIANVPITVSPGSLQNSDPQQLSWISCMELVNARKTDATFRLLNQDLLTAPTNEDYTFTILFRWQEKIQI